MAIGMHMYICMYIFSDIIVFQPARLASKFEPSMVKYTGSVDKKEIKDFLKTTWYD